MMTKRIALFFLSLVAIATPAAAQSTTARFDRYTFNVSACTMRSDNVNTSPEGRVTGNICDTFTQVDGSIWTKISGTGTTGWLVLGHVTSVGLSLPSIFSVSGSPVTTSGTLTATLAAQPATSVFAGPTSGADATPTFKTSPTLTGLTVNTDATFGALGTGTTTFSQPAQIIDAKTAVIRNRAPWANYVSDWYVDNQTGVTHWVAYDKSGTGSYLAMEFKGSGITLDADATLTGAATIAGNTNISGYVGHPSFSSQTTKWRIDNLGGADFRYLYVDELHAKRFIADLEQALAGAQIISTSVAVIAEDFACPATPGIGTLTVEDLPGASNMLVFQSGDWVVLRTFSRAAGSLTIADCVGQVTSPDTSGSGTQMWVFTRPTSGGGSLTPGLIAEARGLALDYGVSGNGVVETTTVDGVYGANSPYTQVKTWTGTPASGNFTVRTRVGNLKGITGTTEWGAVFGTWAATAGQYLLLSDQHFEVHGIDLALFNGSTRTVFLNHTASSLSLGNPAPTSYGSGTGFFAGLDAGCMKVHIGDYSSNYIDWNCSQLTVSGNIVVVGTSIDAASVVGVAGATVVSGAARGTLGLDSFGNPVLPHAASPSGSGLFLGSDYMGYFTASAWKTVITSAGDFYLGGSGGPLTWTAGTSTLTIAHAAGTTGGWTVTSTAIKDAAGVVGLSSAVTGGNDCRFWAGHASCASAPFRVFEDGSIIATSGTYSGALSAATGTFAGSLSAATGTFAGSLSAATGTFAGSLSAATGTFAGSLSAATGSFSGSVTATSLTATTAGDIAGWLLSSTSITDASGAVGLSSVVTGGNDCRFFAGNVTCSSAPFRVYENGAVNLDSGSFGNGGVIIDATGIAIDGGGTITAGDVVLNASGVTAGGTALTGSGLSAGGGAVSIDSDGITIVDWASDDRNALKWSGGAKVFGFGDIVALRGGSGGGINVGGGNTVTVYGVVNLNDFVGSGSSEFVCSNNGQLFHQATTCDGSRTTSVAALLAQISELRSQVAQLALLLRSQR